MLLNPRKGQLVRVWYATRSKGNGLPAPATFMPFHGCVGRVAIVGHGRPRNHGVRIADELIVIPAGNLFSLGRSIPDATTTER